eukprot:4651902-Amphidinium_carterae.2
MSPEDIYHNGLETTTKHLESFFTALKIFMSWLFGREFGASVFWDVLISGFRPNRHVVSSLASRWGNEFYGRWSTGGVVFQGCVGPKDSGEADLNDSSQSERTATAESAESVAYRIRDRMQP